MGFNDGQAEFRFVSFPRDFVEGLIEKIKSGGDCFEEKGRKRGRKDGEGSRGIVAFISRFLRATASTI